MFLYSFLYPIVGHYLSLFGRWTVRQYSGVIQVFSRTMFSTRVLNSAHAGTLGRLGAWHVLDFRLVCSVDLEESHREHKQNLEDREFFHAVFYKCVEIRAAEV